MIETQSSQPTILTSNQVPNDPNKDLREYLKQKKILTIIILVIIILPILIAASLFLVSSLPIFKPFLTTLDPLNKILGSILILYIMPLSPTPFIIIAIVIFINIRLNHLNKKIKAIRQGNLQTYITQSRVSLKKRTITFLIVFLITTFLVSPFLSSHFAPYNAESSMAVLLFGITFVVQAISFFGFLIFGVMYLTY